MKKNFLFNILILIFQLNGLKNLPAQTIQSSNIQSMAIYKYTGEISDPGALNFNILSPSSIDSLISSIDFSIPRDGSDLLSMPNACIYIKFKDNSITVFELFDVWMHICRLGHMGRCYSVSQTGRNLFEIHSQ